MITRVNIKSVNCILISKREGDRKLCEELAARLSIDLAVVPVTVDVPGLSALSGGGKSFVFLDVDSTAPEETIPLGDLAVELPKLIPPERVFILTDKPSLWVTRFLNASFFGHYVIRNSDPSVVELLYGIMACELEDQCIDLNHAFPGGTLMKGIVLKASHEREVALHAVQNLLQKRKVHPRIATLLVQSMDELLMNALFDAPMKMDRRYRYQLDRTRDFPLSETEQVTLELSFGESFVGLSVTDHFGSLNRGILERLVWRDYSTTDYAVREDKSGAGLGVHGIVRSGVCLMFVVRPGSFTRALVFVLNSKNYRSFRKGYQVLSVVFDHNTEAVASKAAPLGPVKY